MSAALKGLLWGVLGVAIFAGTVPAVKLATIRPGFDGLSPVFIAIGRGAVAGILSMLYLLAVRAPWPSRSQIGYLYFSGAGTVIGFPLFMGLAVPHVDAVHIAVVIGALPLATAVMSTLIMGTRASRRFWALAILGFALVAAFAMLSAKPGGGQGIGLADGLTFLAVLSAAFGYAFGARLSREMKAAHVICWAVILYMPVTSVVFAYTFPQGAVAPQAWAGFAYSSLFSMWLGFFAWYRGLASDPMRVSQTQLIQPFLSMMIAVPLLGESISLMALGFTAAIIVTVVMSRRAA